MEGLCRDTLCSRTSFFVTRTCHRPVAWTQSKSSFHDLGRHYGEKPTSIYMILSSAVWKKRQWQNVVIGNQTHAKNLRRANCYLCWTLEGTSLVDRVWRFLSRRPLSSLSPRLKVKLWRANYVDYPTQKLIGCLRIRWDVKEAGWSSKMQKTCFWLKMSRRHS